MNAEKKNGRYEKFDWRLASWACPECRNDSLKLDYNTSEGKEFFTFECNKCHFNSKDFVILMKPSTSFNKTHRSLMKNWSWLKRLTNKAYARGIADTMNKLYQ